MLLSALVLNLREDPHARDANASLALGAHRVPVEEDRQQHAEYLASSGDRGTHEGIEICDRIEDEALADSRA